MTTLFDAVQRGDSAAAEQMLRSHPELHATTDFRHNTPLHEAIRVGCFNIARMLIECGANVNAAGDVGNTPLHYAAESEQPVELAQLLIQSGADLEKRNQHGETPLLVAATYNVDVARLFLQLGAKLDLNSAVLLGITEAVQRLLKHDPHLRDVIFPQYLVRQAVGGNSQEILRLLIGHGVKPNSLALFEALERILNGMGDIDTLRLLLEAGADPNSQLYDNSGDTALHYTKRFRGDLAKQVAALLTQYGAKN